MYYKLTKLNYLFTFVMFFSLSCAEKKPKITPGLWHSTIATAGGPMPFVLEIVKNADSTTYKAFALNADERFEMDTLIFENDSVTLPISLYDAKIVAKLEGQKLTGRWERYVGDKKFLGAIFKAELGQKDRFTALNTSNFADVSGKWTTNFVSENGKNKTEAVGVFSQNGQKVKGTFLTTTGDYRYLEGIMDGDSLKLSAFDGTHLYLFKAKKTGNQLSGQFWSNIKSLENWEATLNPAASLPDLNKLTYLKPGFSKIEFEFPIVGSDKKLNINDKGLENKVKIIQLMGTWCPNCMDETKYLAPWYDKNKARGVEIIGLSYEKSTDMAVSGPKIEKMKQRFGVNYPILLAGSKNAGEAAKSLPMLNTVLGFPTTIIIDKKGIVRNIHTGFSGPGTGQYYTDWAAEFNNLMDKLLAE